MRYYGFGNYYLSSLQQGLQAHHVCVEMFNDYNPIQCLTKGGQNKVAQWSYLDEWARDHKTIVLLNGGNSADLKELYDFMFNGSMLEDNKFPFARFSEDEASLCGALTSVGIVLPPYIYDTAAMDRRVGSTDWNRARFDITGIAPRPCDLNIFEEELIVRLNQYGLAK